MQEVMGILNEIGKWTKAVRGYECGFGLGLLDIISVATIF